MGRVATPPEWEADTLATTIRLTRMGKKKRPFYRLVVLDSRTRRDGAYLANLGYYNPFVDPHEVELHHDEIISWLAKGAEVRDTARSLLKREGILYQFSLVKQGLAPEEIEAKMEAWRPGQTARIARQEEARTTRLRQIDEVEQKKRDDAAKAAAAETAAAEAAAAEAAAAEKAAAEATAEAEGGDAAEADTPAEGA
jgi:small subunit ribosomal protein S16